MGADQTDGQAVVFAPIIETGARRVKIRARPRHAVKAPRKRFEDFGPFCGPFFMQLESGFSWPKLQTIGRVQRICESKIKKNEETR